MRLTLSQWGLRAPRTPRLGGNKWALPPPWQTQNSDTSDRRSQADILRTTKVALDAILLNGADPASTMKEANEEVNALFE
jgi:hypothetical protein